MSWTAASANLVCPCNTVWGSVLPPPSCSYHSLGYHPSPLTYSQSYYGIEFTPAPEYVGKHRKAV